MAKVDEILIENNNSKNLEMLIDLLRRVKEELSGDGFDILGIFGSYSRSEQNPDSDIDILYELNKDFLTKYPGFKGIDKLDQIQNLLHALLNVHPDTVRRSSLPAQMRERIERELVSV